MAAFTEAAPILAALGVPTIPTRAEAPHVPRVKHPESLRVGTMEKLLSRPGLATANAALLCGPVSGVTVLDIDSPDPTQHEAAIEAFGDSPLKVGTPSGGLHLYYRHNGESRMIRPYGATCPLDILGNGLAILAPSHRPARPDKKEGDYRLIEGTLQDLQRLPPMKDATARLGPVQAANIADVQAKYEGGTQPGGTGRNVDLFHALIQAAHHVPTFDALLIEARAINASFAPPLPDSEAMTIARKVWQYRESGNLWGGEARAAMSATELKDIGGNSDALCLMMHIRAAHGWRVGSKQAEFILANALGVSLGWSVRRFRNARDWLSDNSYLTCVHPGGNGAGDPPRYQFGEGVQNAHQYNIPPLPSLRMQSESKRPDQSKENQGSKSVGTKEDGGGPANA